MMTKVWMSLAAASLALGCAQSSGAAIPRPDMSPRCEIRATALPGGLRLEGVVCGKPGDIGSYRFMLDKDGSKGSSHVEQGGEFTIQPSGEVMTSATELNLGAHTSYKAVMTVSGPAGQFRCVRS